MSKIVRTEPNKILAKAVEYHDFVYVQGVTAQDVSKDIKGQTGRGAGADRRHPGDATAPTRPGSCRRRSG